MPKQLQKSLQDCLSKMRKPTRQIRLPSKYLSSSSSWILRGCKHPRTPSFAMDNNEVEVNKNDDAATLSDIDRFLFENFKSLYQNDPEEHNNKGDSNEVEEKSGGLIFESPMFIDPLPDLCGSNRFFVAPSPSSSLIEEARLSVTMSEAQASPPRTPLYKDSTKVSDNHAKEVMDPDDFIALLTYSPNPAGDFRHSMQEMVEARLHHNGKVNWEFMEELLFCYLNLNNKKSSKYILSAFVDLIVILRQNSGDLQP